VKENPSEGNFLRDYETPTLITDLDYFPDDFLLFTTFGILYMLRFHVLLCCFLAKSEKLTKRGIERHPNSPLYEAGWSCRISLYTAQEPTLSLSPLLGLEHSLSEHPYGSAHKSSPPKGSHSYSTSIEPSEFY
jgi:hypothetical protein